MPTIQIDGKDYDTNMLTDEVKKQIETLQIVYGEIRRLQAKLKIANTAVMSPYNS